MGMISERVGECARVDTSLLSPLSPLNLSCNLFLTRVGISNSSELCLACLLERVGDGLRLRLIDVEDMAKDGTVRKGDRRDEV